MKGDHLNNKKEWDDHQRIDISFVDEIREIIRQRVALRLEDPLCPNGIRRATKAMTKTSVWPQMKEILINSTWEEDRWQ